MIDGVFHDSTSNDGIIGIGIISKPWLDSNIALAIVEENGGKNFRNQIPEYKIEAALVKSITPNSSINWQIKYSSKKNINKSLSIGIDATFGDVSFKYP